jgi:hypothetical protein
MYLAFHSNLVLVYPSIDITNKYFFSQTDPEGTEVYIITDKNTQTEHVIQFSTSLRGKPAIMGMLTKLCLTI